MSDTDVPAVQQLQPGTRCLAAPFGAWEPATIRRANEDGTYTLELGEAQRRVLPLWYGVPRDQIARGGQAGPGLHVPPPGPAQDRHRRDARKILLMP